MMQPPSSPGPQCRYSFRAAIKPSGGAIGSAWRPPGGFATVLRTTARAASPNAKMDPVQDALLFGDDAGEGGVGEAALMGPATSNEKLLDADFFNQVGQHAACKLCTHTSHTGRASARGAAWRGGDAAERGGGAAGVHGGAAGAAPARCMLLHTTPCMSACGRLRARACRTMRCQDQFLRLTARSLLPLPQFDDDFDESDMKL